MLTSGDQMAKDIGHHMVQPRPNVHPVYILHRDARDCYYADDVIAVLAAIVLGTGPGLVLARSLLKVNDSFKIREELTRAIVGCALITGD